MENSHEEPSETNDATTAEDVNLNLNTNNNVQPHGCQNQTSAHNNYNDQSVKTANNICAKDDDPDRILNRLKNLIFHQDFNCCDEQQLQLIVTELTRDHHQFLAVVTNEFGSNSVQSLIEKIRNSDGLRNKITSRMAKEITTMMCVPVSFHVVRKCFECLSDRQKKKLFNAIIKNYAEIVTNGDGYEALGESLIEFPERLRNILLEKISSQACNFVSQHSHGNHTVQTHLEIASQRHTKKIFELVKGHFVMLSMGPEGNYLVQNFLSSGKERMDIVLRELIKSGELLQITNNKFGHHVIIKVLDQCTESRHFYTFLRKLYQDKHLLYSRYKVAIGARLENLQHRIQ